MQKRVRNLSIKSVALSQIFILFMAMFAFAFMLGGASLVDGQEFFDPTKGIGGDMPSATQAAAGMGGGTGAGAGGYYTPIGEITTETFGTVGAPLIAGVVWAGIAYGLGQMIGSLAGLEEGQTQAISTGLAAAAFSYHLAQGTGVAGQLANVWGGTVQLNAGIIGVVIGAVVVAAMYKKEKEETITFTCTPWQAPVGGSNCERCNDDPMRLCTEYRCKSLGQACELLNKEMPGQEKCTWVNPRDVTSPTIAPWREPLSPSELNYIEDTSIRPPALGVRIVKGQDGCLQAFTPLEFGLSTNEPAQCRIDFNHTTSFDDMVYWLGESANYAYNHTQRMRLPGPDAINASGSPILQNDGSMQLFVRCRDANGNENADEYSVRFCVDPSPDTTAPLIESTSIQSGNPVRYGADKVEVSFYVNEPAECKWGITAGQPFDNIANSMDCETNPAAINALLTYECRTNLTGIENNVENKFYIRCKDKPGEPESERNVMTQDYVYVLKGSQPLNIIKVGPNETVSGSTEAVSVDLTIETDDGAEEGRAFCFFSPDGEDDTYVQMAESDNYLHKQTLQLITGTYKYYYRCTDLGGNSAESEVEFSVFSDREAPKVTRAYKEEGAGLKIVTNEDADCVYSLTTCNYVFDEGLPLEHSNPSILTSSYVAWDPNSVYYIKCRDMYGNEVGPNQCSIIVRAVEVSSS